MKRLILLAVATLCLLSSAAAAYVPSPRYGAFELRFGPHRPDSNAIRVTDEALSNGDVFGARESMFRAELELDWQFARIKEVMSFGVGGLWGFMREEGKALYVDDTGAMQESSDTTALNVMPFGLVGVIRLDVLHEKLSVPLQPYFKGGLAWYVWWTRTAGETDNSGGTPGFILMPGLAIQLDWIDETTARTFDNEVGVNNSYIFFEYVYARVEGFGDSGKMPLSPTNIGAHGTWMVGLCLEF